MKTALFVLLSLFVMETSWSYEMTNEWMSKAFNLDESTLPRSGRIMCEEIAGYNAYLKEDKVRGYGDDQEEALENFMLLCVKRRCDGMGRQMSAAIDAFAAGGEFDVMLRSMNYTEEQIAELRGRIGHVDQGQMKQRTCQEGTVLQKVNAWDACAASALRCGKMK